MFINIRGHTIYNRLRAGPVVIDLGANRGYFSKEMSDRFGGRYLLVEPNPVLSESLMAEGRFQVLPCAVSAAEGTVLLNVARNDEGSSILPLPTESPIDCVLRKVVEIPTRKLDAILAELGAPTIDLLKIDIEGAEVQVLASAGEAMLKTIGQITVEFHCDPVFGFRLGMRGEVERVIRRLHRLGFICLDFSAQTRCDVLFINRRMHPIPLLRKAWWEFQFFPPRWLHWLRSRVLLRWRTRLRNAAERPGPGEPRLKDAHRPRIRPDD